MAKKDKEHATFPKGNVGIQCQWNFNCETNKYGRRTFKQGIKCWYACEIERKIKEHYKPPPSPPPSSRLSSVFPDSLPVLIGVGRGTEGTLCDKVIGQRTQDNDLAKALNQTS